MALADITTAFSGNPLDRADHLRTDPEIFGDYMQREDARIVLLAGESRQTDGEVRVSLTSESRILTDVVGDIAWQSPRKCRFFPVGTTIFLGLDNGSPRYAAMLNGSADDFTEMFEADGAKFRDGRGIAFKLGGAHPSLGIIAQAKSMLLWHESHRFCAKCGEESKLVKAGYERKCAACETSHFPRTDPVVIMLVRAGEKALVGRGKGWPEGHYSALAGFMEPGESMEEAVAREVFEEVGLKTTRVHYKASQPWPWPSSLMIGVEAWVKEGELNIDSSEIEDAIWITKEDVLKSMREEHPYRLVPPPFAIAHNLIKAWIEE
ncbi:NAD(+) diphosphatase [Kordiimonas laminariae]|uniref:NAD(+) diphosphatase n=1 Tax=Kordiimonas laminariae TaxID=2917717 RepID=UPI001FF58E88|nr:NAD(+) diphosphatase [Kordiimonas laminariae]MCK0069199.1 NAD(+) diphosphatase [Kordiimonas laminariae]